MTTPQPPAPEPSSPYGSAPQPPAPEGAYGAPAPQTPAQQGQNAMLVHLGGILFGFVPGLVVWLTTRGRRDLLEDQSLEALNFQITVAIAWVAAFILSFVVPLPLVLAVWVANLVFSILAGVSAKDGNAYRYPVTLRLVK